MMDARVAPLRVASAGAGPPLVLLHGWALHAGLFAPIVPLLASRHRVHAVDLPGHGASPPLPDWSLPRVVAALDATLGDEHAPVDVLGWSLGGLLALAWAHAHPQRVRRLVLVAATPRFLAGPDWPHAMAPATLARFAGELAVAYRPTLRRFLALQVEGSDERRVTLAALREAAFARATPDPAVLRAALRTLAAVDLRPMLAAIAQPTLVLAGERDVLVPPAASASLARGLRNARHVLLPGAAHAPFLSHRAAFADAVLRFLA